MNNYVDIWDRIHNKSVTIERPISSNNGWIYTAYYYKLNNTPLYLRSNQLIIAGKDCAKNLKRHPFNSKDDSPPISRDEVLGLAYLGFLKPQHLNGWNFSPYPIPKFNLIKTIQQFIELKGKHRNYLWQNNMNQTYRFAFSVPLQDRAFMLECFGETKSLRYMVYDIIAKLDAKFAKPKNGIHWLKYGGEHRKKIMQEEFPEDHPLRRI